jgi:hypothetical protein
MPTINRFAPSRPILATLLVALTALPAWAGAGGIDGSGTAVPGPAALALLAVGIGGLMAVKHFRRRR